MPRHKRTLESLNPKQRKFLIEYLQCWNATEAARRAGYPHPGVQAFQVLDALRKGGVLQVELDRRQLDADCIRAMVDQMATYQPADIAKCSTLSQMRAMLRKHPFAKVKLDSDGKVSIELPNKLDVLQFAAKLRGLGSENQNLMLSGPGGEPMAAEFHVVLADGPAGSNGNGKEAP